MGTPFYISELCRIRLSVLTIKTIAVVAALLPGLAHLETNASAQVKFRQPDVPQKRTLGGQLISSTRLQDRLQSIRKNVSNTFERPAFSFTPQSANPSSPPTIQPPVITLPPPATRSPGPPSTRSTPTTPSGALADFGDDGFLAVELGKGGLNPYPGLFGSASATNRSSPRMRQGGDSRLANSRQDQEELPAPLADLPNVNTEGLEEIRQNFPDGRPQIIRYVAQDEQGNYYNQGPWKVYNQADPQEIVASGNYKQGRMHGQWRRQHDAGSGGLFATKPFDLYKGPFLSVAEFHNGRLDGIWSIYDVYQRNIFEISYKDGVRDGTAIWWYPNRTKMREATFKNGLLHGEILAWDESEKLIRREEFVEGRRIVRNTTYYRGKQKQTEDYFLDAQLIPEGEDDWWQAKPTPYLPRGSKIQNGPSMKWYENKQPKQKGQFKDGVQVGQFTWWHANGNKQIEGFYVDGRKNRLWTWWYENGMKQFEGAYEDDQPVGRWRSWHADGRLRKEEDFSRDVEPPASDRTGNPNDARPANPAVEILPPAEALPVPENFPNNLEAQKPGETILEGNQVDDLEGIEPLNESTQPPAAGEGQPDDDSNVGGSNSDGSLPTEFFQLEDRTQSTNG